MAKLTVTFPHYKQQDMLRRALQALRDQTFQDFRIVILDDASGEDYAETLELFPDLDIKVEVNRQNLGAMGNMLSSILYQTESLYVLSHHADDFLKSDYLERTVALLDENPDVSFVATGPEWVPQSIGYRKESMTNGSYEIFDAPDFVYKILRFLPLMFGTVVYRRAHLVSDWKFDTYDLFCDRYLLVTMLTTYDTRGAFLLGKGIFERNHALDMHDGRDWKYSKIEDCMLNLLTFYKEILLQKYVPRIVDGLITNSVLYYYASLPPRSRSTLVALYEKQKSRHLIRIANLNLLGLYALLTLPFSPKQQYYLRKAAKKTKQVLHI